MGRHPAVTEFVELVRERCDMRGKGKPRAEEVVELALAGGRGEGMELDAGQCSGSAGVDLSACAVGLRANLASTGEQLDE